MALKKPISQLQPKSPIYFKDSEFTLYDSQDESKWAKFDICLFPSQATMIYRLPPRCGTLMLKEDFRDWIESNPVDNSFEIVINFEEADEFIYNCPFDMKITSYEYENDVATFNPILGTNLSKYDKLTITASTSGLIILKGEEL